MLQSGFPFRVFVAVSFAGLVFASTSPPASMGAAAFLVPSVCVGGVGLPTCNPCPCLDPAWSVTYDGSVHQDDAAHTVLVGSSAVYVGATVDNHEGEEGFASTAVLAYDFDGDLLWSYFEHREGSSDARHLALSPDESRLYVGGGIAYAGLIALDTDDGTLLWTADAPQDYVANDLALSPDGSRVFVAAQSAGVLAFDADDGSLQWSAPAIYFLGWDSVAVVPDGSRVIVGGQAWTAAYDAVDGSLEWSASGTAHQVLVDGAGQVVFAVTHDPPGLKGLNATTGAVEWTRTEPFYAPAVLGPEGDTLYGKYHRGTDLRGNLAAVSTDGSLLWASTFFGNYWDAFAVAPDGSTILAATGDAGWEPGSATLYDSSDGSRLQTLQGPFVAVDVAFIDASTAVAVGTMYGPLLDPTSDVAAAAFEV